MRALSEMRYHLTPYGIWYYGAVLDKLVEKLENALRMIIYFPPDVRAELEALSQLEYVEYFEDIGKEAREWLNFIRTRVLVIGSCENLYERAINWRISFKDRANEFLLVKPRLQRFDKKKLIEEVKSLPEDPRISEWLKADENRMREFREGCYALIYGLSTAAGFYFMRLCERALRELYEKIKGEEAKKKAWKEILDTLEEYYKGKHRPEVLHLISYLRTT